MTMVNPAYALSADEDTWLSINGISEAQYNDDLGTMSATSGVSVADLDERIREEAEAAMEGASRPTPLTFDRTLSSQVREASVRRGLPDARYRGDIYFRDAGSSGFNFGHVGIYSQKNEIIEAPGWNSISRKISPRYLSGASGVRMMYVDIAEHRSNNAANRAYRYLGRWYNPRFWDNKTEQGAMNCSQLVWASYMYSEGVNLDPGANSWGVYPWDIVISPWTVTYRSW